MRFNLKVILLAGLAFYVTQWIVGMPFGMLVHEGVLAEAYDQTESFWRPELNEDPPNIGALMPMWLTLGIIGAFIYAFIYDNVRAALGGAAWMKGLKFGVIASLFAITGAMMSHGVFNLPAEIWVWWSVERVVVLLLAGIVLGIVTTKLAPGG